ncbi:hypothetical protein ACQKJ1_26115 [Methylorubrum rhodesianum]|uniref:hypothetical protein n=1 Tax=Methylorubrum rhodesianum TaxID=29427 RepID=UPI003D090562
MKTEAPQIDPRALAVRDCVEASRLSYRAARVLGHEAVSELLSSLDPPAYDEEDERAQTDEEAAAAHLAGLEELAREAAPDADGPDDIEEMEDGTIRVTSTGFAEIAGMTYGTACWWFRTTGLKGQVDLEMIEQVLAGQEARWRRHAGTEATEVARILKGVRRYLELFPVR